MKYLIPLLTSLSLLFSASTLAASCFSDLQCPTGGSCAKDPRSGLGAGTCVGGDTAQPAYKAPTRCFYQRDCDTDQVCASTGNANYGVCVSKI